MYWLFSKKKKPLSGLERAQALAARPVKNNWVLEEWRSENQVRLIYQTQLKPWFVKLSARWGGAEEQVRTRKLELDEMGTACWKLIDGQASVARIGQIMAAKYGVHPKEAELALSQFLRDLGKRGLIGLKAQED